MFEEVSLMQWLVVAAVFLVLAIWAGFRPVLDLFGGQFRKPNSVKMPFGRFRGRQGVEFEYVGWKNKDTGMPSGTLRAGDYAEAVDWDELVFPPAAVAPMNTEAYDILLRSDMGIKTLREAAVLKDRVAILETEGAFAWEHKFDSMEKMATSMESFRKKIGSSVMVSGKGGKGIGDELMKAEGGGGDG